MGAQAAESSVLGTEELTIAGMAFGSLVVLYALLALVKNKLDARSGAARKRRSQLPRLCAHCVQRRLAAGACAHAKSFHHEMDATDADEQQHLERCAYCGALLADWPSLAQPTAAHLDYGAVGDSQHPIIFGKSKDTILVPEVCEAHARVRASNGLLESRPPQQQEQQQQQQQQCDLSSGVTTRVLTDESGHSIKIRIASPPAQRHAHATGWPQLERHQDQSDEWRRASKGSRRSSKRRRLCARANSGASARDEPPTEDTRGARNQPNDDQGDSRQDTSLDYEASCELVLDADLREANKARLEHAVMAGVAAAQAHAQAHAHAQPTAGYCVSPQQAAAGELPRAWLRIQVSRLAAEATGAGPALASRPTCGPRGRSSILGSLRGASMEGAPEPRLELRLVEARNLAPIRQQLADGCSRRQSTRRAGIFVRVFGREHAHDATSLGSPASLSMGSSPSFLQLATVRAPPPGAQLRFEQPVEWSNSTQRDDHQQHEHHCYAFVARASQLPLRVSLYYQPPGTSGSSAARQTLGHCFVGAEELRSLLEPALELTPLAKRDSSDSSASTWSTSSWSSWSSSSSGAHSEHQGAPVRAHHWRPVASEHQPNAAHIRTITLDYRLHSTILEALE